MRKTLIGIFVLGLLILQSPTHTLSAQNSEVGACVGTTFYLGELNPTHLFAQPKLARCLPRWTTTRV